MKTETVAAFIASAVALISAALTVWSSVRNAEKTAKNARLIEELRIESLRVTENAQKRERAYSFLEPLGRSAYDLQSRIFNIVRNNFVQAYIEFGNAREKSYALENSVFLICQFLCWAEIVRRDMQFVNLGQHAETRKLSNVQDAIRSAWGSDKFSPAFRIFAGEQRALGEALIETHDKARECMGFGKFLKEFPAGKDSIMDALREDLTYLVKDLASSLSGILCVRHI
jgi:hypothetical protein